MSVHQLHIPGEAARRAYAVYVIVGRKRDTNETNFYVGKTGDNRDGCNPIISRAGNHLSFNPIHSQSRNYLGDPENYDFDIFFMHFGDYVEPSKSREGIDVINEMERRLNFLVQQRSWNILNPLRGSTRVPLRERAKREGLATRERIERLEDLIQFVEQFINHK